VVSAVAFLGLIVFVSNGQAEIYGLKEMVMIGQYDKRNTLGDALSNP